MAAKGQNADPQMNKSFVKTLIVFLERKKMKTVLAPNAPWPKHDEAPVKVYRQPRPPAPKLNLESLNVDYFKETREELNQSKIAANNRIRDKLSGRFQKH